MYSFGFKLIHPLTKEFVASFEGYTEDGQEVWLTPNGIEECTFVGFTDDGWTRWTQNIENFSEIADRDSPGASLEN